MLNSLGTYYESKRGNFLVASQRRKKKHTKKDCNGTALPTCHHFPVSTRPSKTRPRKHGAILITKSASTTAIAPAVFPGQEMNRSGHHQATTSSTAHARGLRAEPSPFSSETAQTPSAGTGRDYLSFEKHTQHRNRHHWVVVN